jgi:hypothetical protein
MSLRYSEYSMTRTSVPNYPIDSDIEMDAQGSWPASVHRFDVKTAAALRAAEAAGRPLLIRGRPGVGKSQTARAAAAAAKRTFLSMVIDGRTEPHDLMWRFDAVRRLAHAQQRQGQDLPPERDYLRPQALWWAFNWKSASEQAKRVGMSVPVIPTPGLHLGTDRAVLLIDEIDKADPELPNALLEVLANQGFSDPHGGEPVTCQPGNRPLVILTTNEERELPAAFLRRCLVLTLQLPATRDKLIAYLVDLGTRHQRFLIGRGRRTGGCSYEVMRQAAGDLAKRRDEVGDDSGLYAPGTAEYLDMLGALATLWPDDEVEQLKQLKVLGEFALQKDQG